MEKLVERFIRYARINSQSDEHSNTTPSTAGQLVLGQMLVNEMNEIGLQDVSIDKNGYIMATLPANTSAKVPVIGFLAHLDTSPDFTAENVKPRISLFTGNDLVLNEAENIILSAVNFPELNQYIGQTLITTDGTTLLGADDKAGIAEIITAMEYLIKHPEIKHGKLRIGFTPDEEIGRGADKFDVKKFGADFAYTMDGGPLGELEYENFNAARAKVTVKGLNVHPGTAKNQMVNSIPIAMEFNRMLPDSEVPEKTENYEGFFHLMGFEGSVEKSVLNYIIRDHDKQLFQRKKEFLQTIAKTLNKKYGEQTVALEMADQYYNMKEMIEPLIHIVKRASNAIKECGIEPRIIPIRGGTDGARLSFMGLPCPNIFAGGHNFHSRYEYIPIKSMEKATEVIIKLIEIK